MPTVFFEKLSGAFNDFICVDNRRKALGASLSRRAKELCDRKTGIGADGLLAIEPSKKAAYRMRILNPDGSEADMCGNGVRCLAYFAHTKGLAPAQHTVETGAGLVRVAIKGSVVKARLTDPKDERGPFQVRTATRAEEVRFLNTGVPHAVILEKDVKGCDVEARGRTLRYHEAFKPKGTNVNFVSRTPGGIAVRTYERGVEAETPACGTGSTASALVSSRLLGLRSPISVRTRGGETLKVHFTKTASGFTDVYLEGPIKRHFQGSVNL